MVLISGKFYILTICVRIGVVQADVAIAHIIIHKSSLDHDSGEKNRGCHTFQIWLEAALASPGTRSS